MSNKVLVVSASDSELGTMNEACKVLKEFGVEYDLTIASAHRTPDRTKELVEKAKDEGIKVIICGAGLAAHLAGVAASFFPLPVIGIPLKSGPLKGLDALLATVQMPSGIPVATVGIDSAKNAGLLAVQILATSDSSLEEKMIEYKKILATSVEEKADKLETVGVEQYLHDK